MFSILIFSLASYIGSKSIVHLLNAVPEQDQGSLELPLDILIHSEREWREQTEKNIVIRKVGFTL